MRAPPSGAAGERQPHQRHIEDDDERRRRPRRPAQRGAVAPPPHESLRSGRLHEGHDSQRDPEGQHHLAQHQRPRRLRADPDDDQRRYERDRPAQQQRHPHVQQPGHDLGARVGAHRRRGQSGGEQPDGEDDADGGPQRRRDGGVRPLDRVRPLRAGQRRGGEQEQGDIDGAGHGQRPHDVDPLEFEQQVRTLYELGYTSITLSQLIRILYEGGELPPRPVMFTFDSSKRGQ